MERHETGGSVKTEHYRERGWWTDEALWERYTAHAAARPDALAVADDRGVELTHSGLVAAGSKLAVELSGLGVKAGDLVLIVMPNRVEWLASFAAVMSLGAVPMTIPVTTDAATMGYLCGLTDVAAIVTTTQSGNTLVAEAAMTAATALERPTAVLAVDSLDSVLTLARGADLQRLVPLGDIAHVMTTSSTTGMPKAVTHSTNTLAALNTCFAERFSLGPDTPILMVSPLGHSVGAIHGARLSMYLGAPLVLQEQWDAERAMALASQYRCDFTSLATPFLKDFLDAPRPRDRDKLDPLRTLLCGGAAVPPVLIDQAETQMPDVFVSVLWGMTEGGVTTCLPTSSRDQRRDTAGCGLPGLELSVVDDSLGRLERGEAGELVMRGPGVFTGYLGQDDLYQELLTPDGYFRTGDLARIDPDGYLHLTGRLKDLIIRGGVNISPVIIEDVLAGHPEVRRVAVIGEPDERLGERLCAVVVAQPQATLSLEDLVAWASDRGLSRRQLPESLRVVEDMPVTAAGKIKKNQLRDQLFGGAV